MKKNRFLFATLLISGLLADCGNNHNTAGSSTDTAAKPSKADTSIVTGNQKSVKNDSVNGDPSAKGASDPDAHLPKK